MSSPLVRSLDELASRGGVTAKFVEGAGTALGHHWQLYGQNGWLSARTVRVHNGGKAAQIWWKALTLTGLDAGNDIHVELRGADDCVLVRASAINDTPATVTATDSAGQEVIRSIRDKSLLTLFGPENRPLAELVCDGDSPWPVRGPAGDVLGEVLAGEPGPSLSAPLWQWIDPQLALNTKTYARTMHLGLRRVKRYSFAPTSRVEPAMALLPLLCGLTY